MSGRGADAEPASAVRVVSDDTLLVFLSDCHIGGDPGHDIFETPDDLEALLRDLLRHDGPVELVLAGDFFDLLRVAVVPDGSSRAAVTLDRPDYAALFAALRAVVEGPSRRVVYLPGNHDSEVWWNGEIRADLRRRGLVTEFALSYAVAFAGDPGRVVYCEHGNQFDPSNAFKDYDDPLDTPLGDHVVTEVLPRLPGGRMLGALHLRELPLVFPLSTLPEWAIGRLFYAFVRLTVQWLLLPLIAAYAGIRVLFHEAGRTDALVGRLFREVAWDGLLLVTAFGLLLLAVRHFANALIDVRREQAGDGGGAPADASEGVSRIRRHLETGLPPPQAGGRAHPVAVFVSGHTHAPGLTEFRTGDGGVGLQVNSGCWLRQLQPLRTRLGAPTVFSSRFVQTHVRVLRQEVATRVELWEHPRPCRADLLMVEWMVLAEHKLDRRDSDRTPRIVAAAALRRDG